MRAQRPQELFDSTGKLIPELKELMPTGIRRMSANPHANGGVIRKALRMPDFRAYRQKVEQPGQVEAENTRPLGAFRRDVRKISIDRFRVVGRGDNGSNKQNDGHEVPKKLRMPG